MTPVYTRILTKEEFGIQDSLTKLLDFSMLIVPLGYYAGLNRFFPQVKSDDQKRKDLIGTAQVTLLISSILAFTIFIAFRYEVVETFIGKHTESIYLAYLFFALTILIRPHSEVTKTILRLKFERNQTVMINVLSYLIISLLGFIFVYYSGMGIAGIFLGALIGTMFAVALGFWFNRNDLVFRMSPQVASEIITYSLPLIASSLLVQGSELIDRYLIKTYLPFENLGDYSIAIRIASLSMFVSNSFFMAWNPYAFSVMDKPHGKKTFREVANMYVLVATYLIAGIITLRAEILTYVAPAYFSVYHLIPLLAFAVIFKTAANMYTMGIQFSKKTQIIPIILAISVISNRLLSSILVQRIGLMGIVIGSLLSFALNFALLFYFSQKYYKVNYDWKVPLAMVSGLVGLTFLINFTDKWSGDWFWFLASLKCILLLSVGGILFWYVRKNISFKL